MTRPGRILSTIGASHIEQDRVHTDVAGSDIVNRVQVANVKALFGGIGFHLFQSRFKDGRVGLFVANVSGVGDARKAVTNAAAVEHGVDMTVGIGDDCNRILPFDA